MNAEEAAKKIDTFPHSQSDFRPIVYIKSAWKEIIAVSTFVGLLSYAFVRLNIITPSIEGTVIILTITISAAFAFSILIHRSIKAQFQHAIPTIHLDRDPAQHTIDLNLKNFIPTGDISILQTWIPESRFETEGYATYNRIKRWQKYIQDSIVNNQNVARSNIRLKVLLLGSEEVLRNRLKYRWDISKTYAKNKKNEKIEYPLSIKCLRDTVNKHKRGIDELHKSLLELEVGVQKYLRQHNVLTDFKVSIRYYRITPCGPIYIFGEKAMLLGFYDHRWTSDRAPAIRIDNSKAVEWLYFSTLFQCIWDLKDPNVRLGVPADNNTTLYTTQSPSWKNQISNNMENNIQIQKNTGNNIQIQKNLHEIFDSAVKAVNPYNVAVEKLSELKDSYVEGSFEKLYVIAFGKAAYEMCRAAEHVLGNIITEGLAITKEKHGGKLQLIKISEASHPVPDIRGLKATEQIINLAERADEKTLLLTLISGGGSALLVAPFEGLNLIDKQKTTELLLSSGADIKDINIVRQHLSKVKGGRLAAIAHPATLFSYIISDVIGDDIGAIASGPTAPCNSTFNDAMNVLKNYSILDSVPEAVLNHILKGLKTLISNNPEAKSDVFKRVKNRLIANNLMALNGAKRKASDMGFISEIKSSNVSGDIQKAAALLAKEAIKYRDEQQDFTRCYISGGETTVQVKGGGKGGRNMELALHFALNIQGEERITLLSAGTDGTDGPTDAAGAIVDGDTLILAERQGCNVQTYLEDNDSYHFFKKYGNLFTTGPTGTNVMDIQILIIEGLKSFSSQIK